MSEVDVKSYLVKIFNFFFFKNSLSQLQNKLFWDFPGGLVVETPPCNAGHMGSIPGLGRSHVPWSD